MLHCDVVLWCSVVLWCCVLMLFFDVVLWCLCCDVVCDGVWDVVCDGVIGGECCGKVKWMILCCLGVLLTDRQTDERTDIGGCRVAFATENSKYLPKKSKLRVKSSEKLFELSYWFFLPIQDKDDGINSY